MEKANRNQALLGINYLILAGLFFIIILITASFLPRNMSTYLTVLKKSIIEFDFIALYVILNFLFPLFIGTIFIVMKNINKFFINVLFSFAIFLIILDLIPIGQEVSNFIGTGTGNIPWTIIVLGFHSYLVFAFIKLRKNI